MNLLNIDIYGDGDIEKDGIKKEDIEERLPHKVFDCKIEETPEF